MKPGFAGWTWGVVLTGMMLFLAGSGCTKPSADGERVGVTTAEVVAERRFDTRGVVREVAADGRKAVIRHEEIPDYMPAMTMELNVREPAEVKDLRAGDQIEFRLNVQEQTHWIDRVRKLAGAGADVRADAGVAVAAPAPLVGGEALLEVGAPFPDVELLGEDGRVFRLSGFRGKAVALTFIFTRCPLPDFCPRMGVQFAGARKQLKADGGLTNWQLLSVSFDPVHDRPEVLKRYAGNHRGGDADRWLFSVADGPALAAMAGKVGLTVVPDAGGFSHNLRTVVIDSAGRLHRRFDGNSWTAAELAGAIREAAGSGGKAAGAGP